MNINELEQLAKAATTGPWIGAGPSFGAAMPKFINEVLVDRPDEEDDSYEICRSPYCFEDGASNDLLYIAAANPSAIRELIAAYREAVDALVHIQRCIPINGFAQIHHESPTWEQIDASLDTAKRLGVE